MSTKVRLTITISEGDMVKLRIVAARNHMIPATMARVWVESRLAKIHVVEPVVTMEKELPWPWSGDEEAVHGR